MIKQPREALADLLWSNAAKPSCQAGLIECCMCLTCATERAREALASATPAQAEPVAQAVVFEYEGRSSSWNSAHVSWADGYLAKMKPGDEFALYATPASQTPAEGASEATIELHALLTNPLFAETFPTLAKHQATLLSALIAVMAAKPHPAPTGTQNALNELQGMWDFIDRQKTAHPKMMRDWSAALSTLEVALATTEQQAAALPVRRSISKLLALVSDYWELAHKEGAEGRSHDTAEGAAGAKWNEIRAEARALATQAPEAAPAAKREQA